MSDVRSLRALAHPLRLRMLSLLTGAELSAAEVARELGTTQANASYHLRTLAAAGQIEVAGTVVVRGGRATRYRYRWEAEPALGSDEEGRAFVRAMADELVRRADARISGRDASILTDAEVWLTPEAEAEVRALVERAGAQVHAEARPPRTDGTVRVNLTAAFFRMRPDRSDDVDASDDDA